jgi:hypothetical protein
MGSNISGIFLAGHLDEMVDLIQVQKPASQQVTSFIFGRGLDQPLDLLRGQERFDR